MLKLIWKVIDEKLIMPFRESHAPVTDIGIGTVVGFIWALTPLVGIQMYLVFMTWVIAKLFRINFTLPIAIALVWITNPLTMAFFYYGFFETGRYALEFGNFMVIPPITMERIDELVTAAGEKSLWHGLVYWFQAFLRDFGIPSMVGGFIWGIVSSIFGYPMTIKFVNKHRTHLAEKEGLTLAQWEAKHVKRSNEPMTELPVYAGQRQEPEFSVARPAVNSVQNQLIMNSDKPINHETLKPITTKKTAKKVSKKSVKKAIKKPTKKSYKTNRKKDS